ncbi:MAG: group II intron maturase-specific domain-containing protein [Dissulfuribacterales bacterium]
MKAQQPHELGRQFRCARVLREKFKWRPHENESTDAEHSGGPPCRSDEVSVMGMEQRGRVIHLELKINQVWEGSLKKAKPFEISKEVVWEAWKQVDDDRSGNYPATSFDFLGFTFRPRRSKSRWGKYFINFVPAVSNKAGKAMRQKARRWKMHLRSDKSLEDLSRMFCPVIRGWINYYSSFYKSALYPTLRHLNRILVRWAMRKFKRLRRHRRRAEYWLGRVAKRQPQLFPHWQMGVKPTAG